MCSRADDAVTVREARKEDMPAIHRMIHELATHEGMPDGPQLSADDLVADAFECPSPWFFALVAEEAGAGAGEGAGQAPPLLGYALCSRAYSSWTRRAFYLEDLYVQPEARRRGIASALMRALCQRAVAQQVHRIDWHVLRGNASAERFYERLGARDLLRREGRVPMRLDRAPIERAAGLPTQ